VKHPWILQEAGKRLLERPEPGIEGFGRDAIHKRKPLQQWKKEPPFQAIQAASWNWVKFLINATDKPQAILDACAAPGSKLIAVLAHLKNFQGPVTACDVSPRRIDRLKDNLQLWGYSVDVRQHDWSASVPIDRVDWILADLPCTGLGTLHTRPDLVVGESWKRLPKLQEQQKQILNQLMTYSGAKLFVSLCSVDPEEIEFVSSLLKKSPNFHSWKDPSSTLTDEGVVGWIYG
jgi:16S rRNA (cytosine967-C5)-methyltransferase